MSRRRCKAKTKKGNACKGQPILGTDRCAAHSPDEVKESLGFGGKQPGAGRPRTPRAVDVLRERIEQDIDRVLDPLWDALEADRGLALTVKGGGMEIGYSADHPTRIQAARELLDRAYGRPSQTTEVTGKDGAPLVPVSLPTEAEWHADVAKVLAAAGVAAAPLTPNGNGSVNGNGHGPDSH